jgi:hypothetical protein
VELNEKLDQIDAELWMKLKHIRPEYGQMKVKPKVECKLTAKP